MKQQDSASGSEHINPSHANEHHTSRNLNVVSSSNPTEAQAQSLSGSSEDANCENDFVFLPAPPPLTAPPQPVTSTGASSARRPNIASDIDISQQDQQQKSDTMAKANPISTQPITQTKQVVAQPKPSTGLNPLVAIDGNSNSSFSPRVHIATELSSRQQQILRLRQTTSTTPHTTTNNVTSVTVSSSIATPAIVTTSSVASSHPQQMQTLSQATSNLLGLASKAIDSFAHSKPTGLLEINTSLNSAHPDKLADLMRQIVSQSDHIYIAIPCAYCHEPIACPPSDISAWLNHMNRVHNCKICPICNKMIGLGPQRDLEIMRNHVNSHLDEDWLERRAPKVCFTFGLQQQWFAGSRCSVRETRYR